jgi:hypothetical protein
MLFIALLFLVIATACFIVASRFLKWNGRVATLVALVVALLISGALGLISGNIPDVPGIAEEAVTISMLKNHADQERLERWLTRTGADWHRGRAWESGEAFGSPGSVCKTNCDDVVQVAFTRQGGLCEVFGDRITMRFRYGKLTTWSIEQAADGC